MIVDQQLHGYDHGHELLSGSIILPPRDQDLVDRLSDIAGPIAPGEKILPYITCYPLPSGSHYVVAKTWHDREAPRAGCVRTRSLLIPMDEWVVCADPSALVAIATDAGGNQKSKRLSIEPGIVNSTSPVENVGAEILEALFLEDPVPVVVFGSKKAELITIRLLTAIWPSMRRRFTVSTFCNSPRAISKKSFDLLFAPVEARSRFSDWKGRRVDGTKAGPSRHRWSSTIADEIFLAPHPSLSTLDAIGEMAGDENGNEEALRLSLLWSELANKVAVEPQAALGLLDIANSRKSRRTTLVNELTPILERAATTVTSTMPPTEAWRFLHVLVAKLGERHLQQSLIRSVSSSTIALAQRHPGKAVEAIAPLMKDGADHFLQDIASGIARSDTLKPAVRNMAAIPRNFLLRTVLASSELSERLLEEDYGIESVLAESLDGASEVEIETARKRILPQLVNDRHAGLFSKLIANASADLLTIEAARLRDANSFTAVALNEVLVDIAQQQRQILPVREAVVTARQSKESYAMLRKLLEPTKEDIRWILGALGNSDVRRPKLIMEVLASASKEQLCSILIESSLLEGVLGAVSDLPAGTEVLARIVENVPLSPASLIALVMKLLTRIDGPRAERIAAVGLDAVLSHRLVQKREPIVSFLLDRASEQLDCAHVLKIGARQDLPADLASSNLVLFDKSSLAVRNKFLKNPMALANTVVDRGSLDLTYDGSEAVGRLLWDSASFDNHGFRLASAKLLSFATNEDAETASPIIAAAFPSVYRELQLESVPDFLSYIFLFVDWDRCKVARRELARGLVSSKWRPIDIALAAGRAGDIDRIIRSIAKQVGGSLAIDSIEREVESIPDPWRLDVKNALKDLRKDPRFEDA